jgi:RND family efflux transporter MFP subunit
MTRNKLSILGITVIVIGVGATVGVLAMKGSEPPGDYEAPASDSALPVKVVHPKKGAMERACIQPGSTQAFESARLFAKVPGFLDSQTVDIGAHVKKDKELAFIYVPDIKANVERNQAAVEKAEASVEQMKSRVDVARANLEAAEATVLQTEAKQKSDEALVTYRTIELGRIQELVKNNSVEPKLGDQTQQYYASAVESEKSSRAAIESARANVKGARAKIDAARADVNEAESEVKLARAILKRTQVDLDFATIKAPFDGVITHRFMNPGDFVKAADGSPNIDPLFTIDRIDLFRVVVYVPERDVRFIHAQTTASMELDALPGSSFPLKMSRYSESLDKRTRLMRVEFDLKNNAKGQIYNDMYGKVTILLEKGTDLLSIPSACLATKPEKGTASVYVVRSGKPKKVDVTIVMDSGIRVAVEGLTAEDQVIVGPGAELARQPSIDATLVKD